MYPRVVVNETRIVILNFITSVRILSLWDKPLLAAESTDNSFLCTAVVPMMVQIVYFLIVSLLIAVVSFVTAGTLSESLAVFKVSLAPAVVLSVSVLATAVVSGGK